MSELFVTPLFDLHVELKAKMVPFAGYDMPVQYPLGVLKEHQHTRAAAGLFDVSHMGQVILRGADYSSVAAALEALVPADVIGLAQGRQRYGMFTNETGGIRDDLMFANRGDHIFMVINAACKEADIAHLQKNLPDNITLDVIEDRALLALQGPKAEAALAKLNPNVRDMRFMDVATIDLMGVPCWISRSGYTGEDGFEISVPAVEADSLARALLSDADVEPIGLGARDSLRLEAGLCLYGHDLDTETSPVEGALAWAIQKVRRPGGARAGGYPGADVIGQQILLGADRKRVGLLPQTRAPMREGVELFAGTEGGAAIGQVTSGGFGPTLGAPLAMGFVPADYAQTGTTLYGEVRGKRLPVVVTALPFVPAGFKR